MKPALLLIDIQNDFLRSPGLQPCAEILTARATALLREARQRAIPVIHVWTTIRGNGDEQLPHWKKNNRKLCVEGTKGHATPPALRPARGEVVVHKTGFNAFHKTEVVRTLEKLRCDTVILAGIHLHACVRTAAVECLERSMEVFVAEDAVASNDPVHAAASRRWLAARCVMFENSASIFARLDHGRKLALAHYSPCESNRKLFEVPILDGRAISLTVKRSRVAWEKWRTTKLTARIKFLQRLAERLEASAPDLARQLAVEIGKPISHGREEIGRAATNVRDAISRATRFEFEKREAAGMVRHEPLGVVAIISPWNNAVAIPIGKIAPALLYGNTVVWKPAPAAAAISEKLLRIAHESGVPRGVVELAQGNHETAQMLAEENDIAAVTLTGSIAAGHAIQEICARRFLPLQAELGGNNAAIVWDEPNLECAAKEIVWGAFGFAGQRCTANRRVIVSRRDFSRFMRALKIAGEELRWGDPLNERTDIGPVITAAKRDEHAALVEAAVKSHAAHYAEFLFQAHAQQSWIKTGAYAQPVILGSDQPNHPLVQEETMSPLLVVQRASSFDEALELCNGVRHGLAAALFSQSARLPKKFLAGAKAGILKINSSTAGANVALPFGGWKMSGSGPPEHGDFDALFYTRPQAVYFAKSTRS
jgi:acyl-CoA reductase-like NAD-dependent aldehyde dehydrogenase/nicotinamidase-related amidase